jgi:hypothetical protein
MNAEVDLIGKLRTDPDLYYVYQANIAMAFYDEVCREASVFEGEAGKSYLVTREELHQIANQAAKNFLNLLIEPTKP